MSHYLCLFLDESGANRGEVPIIASTDADAMARARALAHRQGEPCRIELWHQTRRLIKEAWRPEAAPSPARVGKG